MRASKVVRPRGLDWVLKGRVGVAQACASKRVVWAQVLLFLFRLGLREGQFVEAGHTTPKPLAPRPWKLCTNRSASRVHGREPITQMVSVERLHGWRVELRWWARTRRLSR